MKMFNKKIGPMLTMIVPWLFIALSTPLAVAADDISFGLIAAKEIVVTGEDGNKKTKLVEPETTVPGDVIVYSITYRNNGKGAAENVIVTDPIPENTEYIGGTAVGPGTNITYSVDGGKIFAEPSNLKITMADGKERAAVAADYTHIRWQLMSSLGSGRQGAASFKIRVK